MSALDQPPSYKIDTPSILDKRKMVRNQWCRQCQTAHNLSLQGAYVTNTQVMKNSKNKN